MFPQEMDTSVCQLVPYFRVFQAAQVKLARQRIPL